MMFPVDTLKTRLQMFGVNCCSNQQWTEALRRPWFKGLPSSLLGQVPNGMLVATVAPTPPCMAAAMAKIRPGF